MKSFRRSIKEGRGGARRGAGQQCLGKAEHKNDDDSDEQDSTICMHVFVCVCVYLAMVNDEEGKKEPRHVESPCVKEHNRQK